MEDNLFDTEEKKSIAISAFGSLLEHPGWKLLVQMLDQEIEILRQELEKGVEGETKEDIDFVRFKLAFNKEQRNKPADQIKKLQSTEQEVPNPDPYPTREDLAKERA